MSELEYNSETGSFTWKTTNRRGFVGRQAGCFCLRSGYVKIRIHGKLELAHRLAWNMTYPDNPVGPDEQIDHINHIRTDNGIVNLRKASNTENSRNASIGSNNTSGAVGVWFEKRRNAWVADKIKELEAENARLRQQRDAANAQLDFLMENTRCDTPSEQNVSSRD